ncbi:hypothetical protein C0Q70_15517 [Pomacea canaliculata]|uniref:Mab-21-like HhH/H2TH-like domain-containing protein n=1 Tax=Pomacea canaliculata TaxID=400727 RepID=A0A2T7NV20_POMCA|nr:hypothetical protein C0Q70_15517 [Pomacea canaliculata]
MTDRQTDRPGLCSDLLHSIVPQTQAGRFLIRLPTNARRLHQTLPREVRTSDGQLASPRKLHVTCARLWKTALMKHGVSDADITVSLAPGDLRFSIKLACGWHADLVPCLCLPEDDVLHDVDFHVDFSPRWQRRTLEGCVHSILATLLHFLERQNLPHFDLQPVNLWAALTPKQLAVARSALERLLTNENALISLLRRALVADGGESLDTECTLNVVAGHQRCVEWVCSGFPKPGADKKKNCKALAEAIDDCRRFPGLKEKMDESKCPTGLSWVQSDREDDCPRKRGHVPTVPKDMRVVNSARKILSRVLAQLLCRLKATLSGLEK